VKLRKSLPVVFDGGYREWYSRLPTALCLSARKLPAEAAGGVFLFPKARAFFRASGLPPCGGRLLLKNYGGELSAGGFVTKPYETRVYLFE
jgi:hypothetical protein